MLNTLSQHKNDKREKNCSFNFGFVESNKLVDESNEYVAVT